MTKETKKKRHELRQLREWHRSHEHKNSRKRFQSSALFTVTSQDEDSHEDLEEYLLRSNLSRRESLRRMSSDEVRMAIQTWALEDLRELWSQRESKLTYLEDCALLLANIRFRAGIDSTLRSAADVIGFDAVQDLAGVLEESGEDLRLYDQTSKTEVPNLQSIVHSSTERAVTLALRAIREGQGAFRRRLIEYYGPCCMVTGTTVAEVIDAAHIIPYGGPDTNTLSNGLLLRKDVHALFDRGLLQIAPDLVIGISTEIEDDHYRAFDGSQLQLTVPPQISRAMLRERMKDGVVGDLGA